SPARRERLLSRPPVLPTGHPLGLPLPGARPRPLLPRRRLPLPRLARRPRPGPCSADTGAYCKARGRLPEPVLARLTRDAGGRPQAQAPAGWRWHGRTVKVVDGTTVSMPDTPANQQEFPQGPGVGFPIARLVVLFSLAVGTALDAALGRYLGERTGEQALF